MEHTRLLLLRKLQFLFKKLKFLISLKDSG
jgi:hypothetical protein